MPAAIICQNPPAAVILALMLGKIGNFFGWLNAAVLAVSIAIVMLFLVNAYQVSTPTQFGLDLCDQNLGLPTIDSNLLPEQDKTDDGGVLYWQAAGEYPSKKAECDAFERDPSKAVPGPVQDLLEAGRFKDGTVYINHLDKLLNFKTTHDEMDNLKNLGTNINGAAFRLIKKGQTEAGCKYAKALIALGQDMIRERYAYEEFDLGVALVDSGLAALADAKLGDVSDKAKQTGDAFVACYSKSLAVWKILGGRGTSNYVAHTGDFLYLAAHAKERLWRDEAILQLGRIRFAAGNVRSDSDAGLYYAQQLSNHPDQVISTAAKASVNLTNELFQGFNAPEEGQ